MDNHPDSPGSGDEEIWSEVDEAFPDGPHPGRRDGFTPKRRRVFLKTLRKTGVVADACRCAGISDTAAYKLRDRDPLFAQLWDTAAAQGGADLELLAWHYAVEGEEVEVWAYGKKVGTRRVRDAALFRTLLQASNPHKYGGNGLGTRKQLEKKVRREMEQRAAEAEQIGPEEAEAVRARIARRIERIRLKLVGDQGGHINEQGCYIPPGYVRAADLSGTAEPPAAASAAADFRDGDAAADVSERDGGDAAGHPIGSWRSCPRPDDG